MPFFGTQFNPEAFYAPTIISLRGDELGEAVEDEEAATSATTAVVGLYRGGGVSGAG